MHCLNSYGHFTLEYIKGIHPFQALQAAGSIISNTGCKILDFVLPVNRVTLHREFRFIPSFIENKIGEAYFNNLCPKSAIVEDEKLKKSVKRVFKNLVKHCERQELDYRIRVAKSNQINAFCLPGGKVVITTAMIDKLNEKLESECEFLYQDVVLEDKLAAVLGHEIVHAAAGHFVRKIEFKMILAIAGFALKCFIRHFFYPRKSHEIKEKEELKHRVGINRAAKENIAKTERLFNATFDAGWGVGSFLFKQQHSRSHELEADKHSINYIEKAGYNPWGAVWIQDMFYQMKKNDFSENSLNFLSTHPTSKERMEKNFSTINALLDN